MNYAAFYTSLILLVCPKIQVEGECIKSLRFIHMLAMEKIVFIAKTRYDLI